MYLIECNISVKASRDTIYVPIDFPTIQEAINNAEEGDTIFVYKGTYYEHITVNKSVSLVGEDRDSTIIDGFEVGNVVSITANKVTVRNFTIQNSGSNISDSGIYVISNENNISCNTIINNKNGIYLRYSDSNTIINNTISSNGWYGIRLHHSNNTIIHHNNVSLNYNDGIYLYYSNNNTISGNTLYSNNNGISLYHSSDNIISDNDASKNDCGIWISQLASNNIISDNNVSSNNNGVYIYYSSDNAISGNNAYANNDYGIYLHHSSSNIIYYNDVSSNCLYGIYLYYSSNDNIICHNNFINNTGQVWTDSVNVWDNGKEGNYWSDYTGQDLNKDGIGDTPYAIDTNNQDNYPLMGTFSDFPITWKEKTYHITTVCNSTISNFKFEVGTETGNKIITFSVTGKEGTAGFCRIATPTNLMNYSHIVLIDEEETVPTILNVSDTAHVYLYFTYVHSSHNITIISSKLLYLYNELLDKYTKLHIDFDDLNSTYNELLKSHNALLENYSQLLQIYNSLNTTHQELEENYSRLLERYNTLNLTTYELLQNYTTLLDNHDKLLKNCNALNLTTHELLNQYGMLLNNYTQLLEKYDALNTFYQDYSELQANYTSLLQEHEQNIRSLIYITIATATIFIVAAAYMSIHAHKKPFAK